MAEEIKNAPAQTNLPPGMKVYYLVFLKEGPNWTTEQTSEVAQLHAAHLAYLRGLRETGKMLLVGPVLDGGNIRGVSVFGLDFLEEIRTLAEADPAVKEGRFIVEIHPWMSYKGIGILPG